MCCATTYTAIYYIHQSNTIKNKICDITLFVFFQILRDKINLFDTFKALNYRLHGLGDFKIYINFYFYLSFPLSGLFGFITRETLTYLNCFINSLVQDNDVKHLFS